MARQQYEVPIKTLLGSILWFVGELQSKPDEELERAREDLSKVDRDLDSILAYVEESSEDD